MKMRVLKMEANNNVVSFYPESISVDTEKALNSCNHISCEVEMIFDVLKDICTKINGHPRQELINSALKRAIYKTNEIKGLKVKLFDEFRFIERLFIGDGYEK